MSGQPDPAAAPDPGAAAPVLTWRCLVSGCRIEGAWQPILSGETYRPPEDPLSHYWQEHYLESESEYRRKIEEQRERRREHYRLTGEILPPQV